MSASRVAPLLLLVAHVVEGVQRLDGLGVAPADLLLGELSIRHIFFRTFALVNLG